jgi:multisubunit Na+/H+ antiporter MnhE subunit
MPQTDGSPKGGGGRAGALRAFAAWWVLCAALWLALIDRTRLDELLTGVVAATIGAVAAVLVRQERQIVMRPQARWFVPAWRQLIAFLTDLWPLTRVLVTRGVLRRKETGQIHELAFTATAQTPRDAAFRVFTAGVGSLGPNTIVLDIDDDEGTLRAHQLAPTSDPARSAMPLDGP